MAEKKDFTQQNSDNEHETDDLPQEITESYGTGVHTEPGYNIGDHKLQTEIKRNTDANPELTALDVDAAWERAADVGDEAVGGTVPTPDQDIVDELGAAVGMEMDDKAFLRTTDIFEQRDDNRWELDPKSSQDYEER
ncbi:DUF6335 family protein [Brasilonema sp. UFV-L1]|uniref:DUF6335 family protein n=1 Tax=Brasilonema sp. UFV-L1 TaxID=2234130 RepID=UPI00145DDC0D|nr:DUF6335 family protein [Brasilonema sp. UFV-L1]NMG05502.1 hypothetical protein [Brasilonema sp. UFV-L1]